jgi:TrmH family RNA methyltransferase
MLSLENSKVIIDQVKRLRKREHREKTGLTIVEGYPEAHRANKEGVEIQTLYICPEIFTVDPKEFNKDVIVEVSKETFAQMAFGSRLKGILAICRPTHLKLSDLKLKSKSLVMVVESVEKPGNLGTIIRSCDGAGVDVLISCDSKTDIYNPNVVRSSIGTVFRVPSILASKEEAMSFLKKQKVQIFAATAKAKKVYSDCDYSESTAMLVGNEHDGISQFCLDQADEKILIPMMGESSSLNVGVSASILMYEVFSQRVKNN